MVERNKLRHRKKSKSYRKLSLKRIVEDSEVATDSSQSNSEENFLKASRNIRRKKKEFGYFSNFIEDYANFKSRYLSDFMDIKHGKMLAFITVISLYLCLLPPTITFAKILEESTNGAMGINECLMSTTIAGTLWGIFAAQPLFLQSVTGPVIIFEGSFYKVRFFWDPKFHSRPRFPQATLIPTWDLWSRFYPSLVGSHPVCKPKNLGAAPTALLHPP